MPHEEPMPPLDAILDGSGVRYYSKRTRQPTSLEKKLQAAREAFHAARKEQGFPDTPKLFHGSGSPPARSTTAAAGTATASVSSAALRRELRRQAVESAGGGGNSAGIAGGPDSTPANASTGGGAAIGSSGGAATSRSRSGRDSDFQRFADALVGGGRGPVVQAKPYHTEARTYWNLSLLPSSVTQLAADSKLYYSPAATTRDAPGPAAKGLRDSMLKYYQPDLALEREERERENQEKLAERLAKAQEALGEHIQGLVARWGPGFLERLNAAVAAEAAGEAGRASQASGGSITSLAAAAAAAAAASGGGTAGRREPPLKGRLSAAAEFGSLPTADSVPGPDGKAAGGRQRRSTSPLPLNGTYSRLYGVSQIHVTAATLERLSYLSEQLKVPMEQIVTLLRKPASAGGSRSGTANGLIPAKRSAAVVAEAGPRPSRRIELLRSLELPTRGSASAPHTPSRLGRRSVTVTEGGERKDAPDGALDGTAAAAAGRCSPFEKSARTVFGETAAMAAGLGKGGGGSASAAAAAMGSRSEAGRSGHGRGRDGERQRYTHLVVAAVAERVAAEARAEAKETETQRRRQDLQHAGTEVAGGGAVVAAATMTAAAAAAPARASGGAIAGADSIDAAAAGAATAAAAPPGDQPGTGLQHAVTIDLPRTPVDRVRPQRLSSSPMVPPVQEEAAAAAPTAGADAGKGVRGEGTVAGPYGKSDEAATSVRRLGLCLPFNASPSSSHQVWSAYPSRRAIVTQASTVGSPSVASAGPSPYTLRIAIGGGGDGDGAATSASPTASTILGSAPASPTVYHHPSGLSYMIMGQAVPTGPSLEGLQPADPRQGELEAASRAALESLARRHGNRLSRHHQQRGAGRADAGTSQRSGGGGGTSRIGSASTASRPGTSGSMGLGERGIGGVSGQTQRRKGSRPASNRGVGVGGALELRRTTAGGMSASFRDDSGWTSGSGGGLRFSERGSGAEDDGEGRGGGGGGMSEPGSHSRNARVRSASSRHSARSGRGRSRASPTSPRPYAGGAAAGSGPGAAGSSGEEVIFATAGGTSRRSLGGDAITSGGGGAAATAASGTGGVSRKDLRRLSDLAVAVGMRVRTGGRRRTSSPRSSASAGAGTAGLINSDDDDDDDDDEGESDGFVDGEDRYGFEMGQDMDASGNVEAQGSLRIDSRPSTCGSAGAGGAGELQPPWELATSAAGAAAAAAAGSRPLSSLPGRVLVRLSSPGTPKPSGAPEPVEVAAVMDVTSAAMTATATAAATAADAATPSPSPPRSPPPASTAPVSPSSSPAATSPAAVADAVPSPRAPEKPSWLLSRVSRPNPVLGPPGLSRHYKLAGSRWNPTAPGALRPGYGTESDYVAGTYNPDLMERVAAARDTSALTGQEVPVEYQSPVQAASGARSSSILMAPSPTGRALSPTSTGRASSPLTQRQSLLDPVGTGAALTDAPVPARTSALDLSMLTPAGRAAASKARAALAIADVLNPVTRALTNAAALVPSSELPPPLQLLASARGMNGCSSSATTNATTATTTAAAITSHPSLQLPSATAAAAAVLAQHLVARPGSPRKPPDVSRRSTVTISGGGGGGYTAAAAAAASSGGGIGSRSAAAAAATDAGERVTSRIMKPSQSVWSRTDLDELDILQPLKQHLLAGTANLAASGGGGGRGPPPASSSARGGDTPERRSLTAPPAPEPRLWRGNPLDLKAAFPKGEKVYRLVTDVTANARLLREVENDITPVEFRNRLRRGVML